MNSNSNSVIFFVGGGTAGPVSPLLAVARGMVDQKLPYKPHFIDTRHATAWKMIRSDEFSTHRIVAAKLRRYRSYKNLLAPLLFLIGFLQSLFLVLRYKPALIVGAGGFAQVPLVWAGWLLRVPSLIHQQDLHPTLSNRLCALPAKRITTTFEKSIKDFNEGFNVFKVTQQTTKIAWIGNPTTITSNKIPSKEEALTEFGLHTQLPVVLVVGGGTGALGLNKLISLALPELTKIAQILHSTGEGKQATKETRENYHPYPFISNMPAAYSAADIIISRAGLGTITELSSLGKPTIVIPMPQTHQEQNAQLLYEKQAAIVLDETETTPQQLLQTLRTLFFDLQKQTELSNNLKKILPPDATTAMIQAIKELISDE